MINGLELIKKIFEGNKAKKTTPKKKKGKKTTRGILRRKPKFDVCIRCKRRHRRSPMRCQETIDKYGKRIKFKIGLKRRIDG